MAPIQRWARRALFVLVAIAALPFALELIIRITDYLGVSYYQDVQAYLTGAVQTPPGEPEEVSDTGRIFENKPWVDLELRTFHYRTDAYGFRVGQGEPDYDPEVADPLRLLFLGDSVTLAWGVEDEDSWIRRVEREGRTPAGEPIRCLNAGHLMYETVQQASLLRALGPRHRPDVVVLTFIYNDIQPTWDQFVAMNTVAPVAGTEVQASTTRSPAFLKKLLPRTHEVWRFLDERRVMREQDRSKLPPYSFYPEGWPRCEGALDDILATCAELGSRLVVVDHTMPALTELTAWTEAHEVPCIRTSFTEEEQERELTNSAIDAHANELGNRILAAKVLAGLREAGILAEAP